MKKTIMAIMFIIVIGSCGVLVGCNSKNNTIVSSNRVFRPARYSYELLGEVKRTAPEVKNGGLAKYPTLDYRMPGATEQEKQAILDENQSMNDYDFMDEGGNLFKNGASLNKKLFKHSAADGQIGGAVSPTAKAVAKKIHIIPSSIGNNPTGLYAPPGEIVTIILNESDSDRAMRCDIGMGSARGGSVGIPTNKEFSRMPELRKHMKLKNIVNFVGSPLGGPIYILNEGENKNSEQYMKPYDVTIIGAVESPHYYLGYTTDEEWDRLRSAPGTIFDMDIFGGIKMTMSASVIRDKSAENMRKVAEFWEKASAISNQFAGETWYSDHPVTQIYDTYIPAGAAVAFVGADFSCIPMSWANGVMNFDSFVLNGAWGDIHEFNHHHQGWGAANDGEVTNNVINIITYMLHTNIGAQRTETGGLGGWNAYTSAYLSLKDVLDRVGKGANTSLSMYATLIHSFGDEAMIAASKGTGARTNELWYKSACKAMGYDLTYYFEKLCGFALSEQVKAEIALLKLPIYVPVANTYQAGNDKLALADNGSYIRKDVMMGKPFYIPFGKEKEIDLNAYMKVPSDVDYEIKNVTAPTLGKLVAGDAIGKYTYIPDKKAHEVAEFRVSVGLKFKDNPSVKIEDVTLIIQLMQDYSAVDGKVWQNPGYSDLETALSENFESLPSTDVQFNYAGASTKTPNSIVKSAGKIILANGKHKLFIKGNEEVLLMTGNAPNKLTKSAHIVTKLDKYDRTREGSFFEVEIKENAPLYFAMYVKSPANGNATSGRIGYEDLSQIQGAAPIEEDKAPIDSDIEKAPIVDIPSNAVLNTDANKDAKLRVQYSSELKYDKKFKANGVVVLNAKDFVVSSAPPMYGNSLASNMLDGKFNTIMHSATNIKFPVEFVIDMKELKTFNFISLFSRESGNNRARVKDFEVYSAETIVNGYNKIFDGSAKDEYNTKLKFNSSVTARYVKIVVKSIYAENYISFSEIQIGTGIADAEVAPATGNDIVYKGKWEKETYGTYLNGFGLSASNGASAEINFHGTDFMLFGTKSREFGKGKIRVDNGEWQSIDFFSTETKFGQPIFGAGNLSDGYHKVELKAEKGNKINVDYYGIAPTTPPRQFKLGLWWIAVGIGIAIVCAGLGTVGFLVGRKSKAKTSDKPKKDKKKRKKVKETITKSKGGADDGAGRTDIVIAKEIKTAEVTAKSSNIQKPTTVATKTAEVGKPKQSVKTAEVTAKSNNIQKPTTVATNTAEVGKPKQSVKTAEVTAKSSNIQRPTTVVTNTAEVGKPKQSVKKKKE